MTPTQIARDALAGQLTPMDALARIAGMEETHIPLLIDPDEEALMRKNLAQCYSDKTLGFRISREHMRYLCEHIVSLRVHIKRSVPHVDSTPAITDEVVERCVEVWRDAPGGIEGWMRAALEEFVRQTRPQEIRRATEQAAREAAMAAVEGLDAHTTVYAQTADREAGGVAWGCGDPFDPWKSNEWQEGWREANAECGWRKQEGVG